jgi:hypothetical protein
MYPTKMPRNPWKSLNFSEKVLKNVWNLYKNPKFLNRSFNFSRSVFKKPRYHYKILILILKKASTSMKMSFKSLVILKLTLLKKPSISLKMFLKSLKIFQNVLHYWKKKLNLSANNFKKPLILWKSLTSI